MRAVAVAGAALLEVVDVDDLSPAPDELLLHVDACGICGSDLHFAAAFPVPGLVLGHEYCGTVIGVGTAVEGWKEGDRAAGLSLAACGECTACRNGLVRKCEKAQMIGIERPGAYAECVTVPARNAHRLPASLDHRHGALVEPLAVGLHAVERSGVQPGDDVLVIGGGPVGLAVAVWLRSFGAREVVVSDLSESRRALAEKLGVTATIDPSAGDVGEAFLGIAGRLPPVVIECVGLPGLIQHAAEVAAIDARLTIAGVCMAPDQIVPFTAMSKELDVRFAFYYRDQDFGLTIDLLQQERIDPTPMVTSEITLDEVPARFTALQGSTSDCKVLIRP